jgi:exopolysaccharide biosynthesis polyprenyl glycosylphosphotransferase
MPRRNSKLYSLILILIDTLVLIAAFVLAYVARVQYDPRPLLNNIYAFDYLFAFLLIVPFWILIFALIGLYQPQTYNRRLIEWSKIAVGVFIGILLVIGWEYVIDRTLFPARLVAVYALIGSFLLIVIVREIMRLIRTLSFRYGYGTKRVLLIGASGVTADIATSLADTARSGYEVVAIAGPKKHLPDNYHAHHYSRVEDALKNVETDGITGIIQTDLFETPERNQKILSIAQSHHIDYSFIPSEAEFYSGKNTVDVFLGYPMITVYQTPLVGWGAIFKRIVDLLLVVLTLPIWLTVLVIFIVLQKIFNPGPAFFVNTRLGRYGKEIKIYKFRSMKAEFSGQDAIAIFRRMGRDDLADEYATHRKVKKDPRVTPFGHFLRITSLDELPQIFNVLRGQMSIVGPRPILPDEKSFYRNRGALLFSVKPGITGLWQVSGRSDLSFEGRVDLELYYAQNWSFWLDLRILFKTIAVVLFGKGAL